MIFAWKYAVFWRFAYTPKGKAPSYNGVSKTFEPKRSALLIRVTKRYYETVFSLLFEFA